MNSKRRCILVLHGPNLNLLGKRETKIYGKESLDVINRRIRERARTLGFKVEIVQSNDEGKLVTALQQAADRFGAVVLNAAAYTHTSVAIRDAVSALRLPVVEVHLSNIFQREAFRHESLISGVAAGVISGFGGMSYLLGLEAAVSLATGRSQGRGRSHG